MNFERRHRRVHSTEFDKENVNSSDLKDKQKNLKEAASKTIAGFPSPNFQQQKRGTTCVINRDLSVDKTHTVSKMGIRQDSDDSGVSTTGFRKAPFPIYGDSMVSEFDQVIAKIRKRAEETNTSIRSSHLRDRDRNVLMAVPAPKKEKTALVETVTKKPAKVEKLKTTVLPRLQVVTHDIKNEDCKEKRTSQLPLEQSYSLNYSHDFIDQMINLDERKKLSSTFLKRGVTDAQRRLIVKYLLKLTTNCRYPSFTTYQAVKIFDSYIDKIDVKVDDLQITALACLWISLKKDLTIDEVPEASYIIQVSGNKKVDPLQYKKSLVKCEQQVLMTLKFEVMYAEPFSLLALYTASLANYREFDSATIQNLYYFGSYVIDLAMMSENTSKIEAVHLSAVAAEISLGLIMEREMSAPSWFEWRKKISAANPTLRRHSLPDFESNYIRVQLLQAVLRSEVKSDDFNICYKKYGIRRYGAVAKDLLDKVRSVNKRFNSFY